MSPGWAAACSTCSARRCSSDGGSATGNASRRPQRSGVADPLRRRSRGHRPPHPAVRQRDARDRRRRRVRVPVSVPQHARRIGDHDAGGGRPVGADAARRAAVARRRRTTGPRRSRARRDRPARAGRVAIAGRRRGRRPRRHARRAASRQQSWLGHAGRRPARADRRRGTAGVADPPGRRRRAAADGGGERRQPDGRAEPGSSARAGRARRARREPRAACAADPGRSGPAGDGGRRRLVAGGALDRRRSGRPGAADAAADRRGGP